MWDTQLEHLGAGKREDTLWDYHSILAALGCLLTGVNLLLA
jgi:hypothetical protein